MDDADLATRLMDVRLAPRASHCRCGAEIPPGRPALRCVDGRTVLQRGAKLRRGGHGG